LTTLAEYKQGVEDLEAGKLPPGSRDRAATIQSLVDQISGHPWATAEERSQAQGLVARLERMRWKEEQGGSGP
jgi:hypothetical protein